MLKRKAKRHVKRTFLAIVLILIALIALILLGLSFKNLIELTKIRSEQKDSIIKPIGEPSIKESLTDALSERNFIMASIVEGSGSAVFIGQIKDGPKVYFSKSHDAKSQVRALELILSKLTIDNKKPTLVDLRFEQPIVKF